MEDFDYVLAWICGFISTEELESYQKYELESWESEHRFETQAESAWLRHAEYHPEVGEER